MIKALILGDGNLTKKANPNNYSYSGYGIAFVPHGKSLLSTGEGFVKYEIIFGAGNSSSVHFRNRKKHNLILGKVPT